VHSSCASKILITTLAWMTTRQSKESMWQQLLLSKREREREGRERKHPTSIASHLQIQCLIQPCHSGFLLSFTPDSSYSIDTSL